MFQGEHSALLLTFIKQPYVFKIFFLSIFEWPLNTGFTVIITGGFNTVFGDLNKYKIVVPLFGAAYLLQNMLHQLKASQFYTKFS